MISRKHIYRLLLLEKKTLNLLGTALHKNEHYQPFFIVGSGRSGNTLLRRILNNHSELFIPPETYVLGKSIKQSLVYPQLTWSDLVSLIYSNFEYYNEFETYKMNSLGDLCRRISNVDKNRQSVAYILAQFYQQYRDEHKISGLRWGDKTPQNTYAMEEIYAVFPQSRFIHIIRDPYDSIVSYVESGLYSDLESAAYRWKESLELAFDFGDRHPDAYYEIKYHDLVTDTVNSVQRICNYLSIGFEKSMLEHDENMDLGDVNIRQHHARVSKEIDAKSIGKGRQSLNKDEFILIDEIIRSSKSKKLINYISSLTKG